MFSPQTIPQLSPSPVRAEASEIVLDLAADQLPPWDPEHWIARRRLPRGKVWQFSVYGGIFKLAAVRDTLIEVFGESNPVIERITGDSALFAFTLDGTGSLLADSATLSACCWAIGRLGSPGPGSANWLEGFESEERQFVAALNRLTPSPGHSQEMRQFASETNGTSTGKLTAATGEALRTGATESTKAATSAILGSVLGPVLGGIAAAVAAKFVEKMLSRNTAGTLTRSEVRTEQGASSPRSTELSVPPSCMTAQLLDDFVTALVRAFDLSESLGPSGIRVKCTQVRDTTADEANEQNFLNSFLSDDLRDIEDAVRSGAAGAGLLSYLAETGRAGRIDVRAAPAALLAGVAPRRIPGGRWPSALAKPLALSQQFAVNEVMAELGSGAGIFAVNGPPGTGKTTMLRDVIASIVVERARAIVGLRLSHPVHAFGAEVQQLRTEKWTASVYAPRPELTGYEVIVATTSNKAAENITAEIPGADAVERTEDVAAADYFTELAGHVLEAPAWGLVAATLGKRSNTSRFAKRFWWGRPQSHPDAENPAEQIPGMQRILKQASAEPMTADTWAEAVRRFTEAEAEVERLTAQRQQVADAVNELHAWQRQLGALEDTIRRSRSDCETGRASVTAAEAQLGRATRQRQMLEAQYQQHRAGKPGFWAALWSRRRVVHDWRTQNTLLVGLRKQASHYLEQVQYEAEQARSAHAEALTQCRRHEDALAEAHRQIVALRKRIEAAGARWPGSIPPQDAEPDEDRFQLCAPWADQEFTAARNTLFLEALRLHKAFVLGAEPRLWGNLRVMMAVLQDGQAIEPSALEAVWRSLFLVVPVVSTTFAALPRLFRGLTEETFGWLFVDEAGQATPQQAVGGIWRARRSVIVGDPQQLEPIVSLPLSAQHALREHYRISTQWTPENTSAQQIADRLACYGTTLAGPGDERPKWVGSPLRVHRRCDEPMFEVSNKIAYNGALMIHGTHERGSFPGVNSWIHVPSGQADGHWVPAEGRALEQLLSRLEAWDIAPGDIRILSPFRRVVRGIKRIAAAHYGWAFADTNVGTVHTVQGQEADVVILVLGTEPHNTRAREWAAAKPNLLNVAVSRAKRRLFVIGDHDRWRNLDHFNVLADVLKVETPYPDPQPGART